MRRTTMLTLPGTGWMVPLEQFLYKRGNVVEISPRIWEDDYPRVGLGAEATGSNVTPIIDYERARSQFYEALAKRGVALKNGLLDNGTFDRANVISKGRKGRNDAEYVFNLRDGGWPRWSIINYVDGLGWSSGSYTPDRELTKNDKDRIKKALKASIQDQQERTKQRKEEEGQIANILRLKFASAVLARPDHEYLVGKQVGVHGVRQRFGALMVPVYIDDEIWSIQYIFRGDDGKFVKTFKKGSRTKGGIFVIAGTTEAVYTAEGYATAATIFEATGATVVVVFSASNQRTGAEYAKKTWPAARVVICGDNDWRTDGDPGLTAAKEAAAALGVVYVVPDFSGVERGNSDTDFNDMARLRGRDAVKELLDRAVAQPPEEPTGFDPLFGDFYQFTDLGNAKRLVKRHGRNLRYVHVWKQWLAWEDGCWRRDEDGAAMRLAKETVEVMFDEAGGIIDEDARRAARKFALESQNAKNLNAMIKLAETEPEVILSTKKIDADPYLLGAQNGVIELRTGTFRPARREDYVVKRAGIAFDPQAKCPRWEEFLRMVFSGDAGMIAYAQRAAGYILTGLTVEEVMFIPWGEGSNGKSTFRETLFAMMGDYAMVADASLMMTAKPGGGPSPEIAKLFGRRLVTINETQQDERLNESRVKFITSHDTITARDMYEKPFDFPPTHKTVMTTNHKPIVRGTDEGIWRRIHLWPFLVRIENVDRIDRYFRERVLIPELPGILNWALAGTAEYFKDGLNPPQAVTGATKKYRSDMDVLGRWVDEQCWQGDGEHCWLGDRPVDPKKVINGVPVWTSGAKLLESYLRWSGSKMSSVGFGRKMTERRYRVDKWGGERGVYGLVLKPQGGTRYGDPASGMGDTEKPGNEYEEVPF